MEAARAMAQGIENADHDAEVRCLPMADGGEGTARALVDATGGSMHAVPVHDPLGRPVEGHFGLLADGTTAVVETAEASGLALLEAKKRNPLIASSYGTGELILAAVRSGAKRIIVGLGGSATNDASAITAANISISQAWAEDKGTATTLSTGERPSLIWPPSTSARWTRLSRTSPSPPPAT